MKKLLMATCAIACVSQGVTSESYASDTYVHIINLSTIATSNTNKTDDNTEYKCLQAKWDISEDEANLQSVRLDGSLSTMIERYEVPPSCIHIIANLPGKHKGKTVHLGTSDTAREAGAFSGLSYHNSHWRDPNDQSSGAADRGKGAAGRAGYQQGQVHAARREVEGRPRVSVPGIPAL